MEEEERMERERKRVQRGEALAEAEKRKAERGGVVNSAKCYRTMLMRKESWITVEEVSGDL